jgi:hypothetical protein
VVTLALVTEEPVRVVPGERIAPSSLWIHKVAYNYSPPRELSIANGTAKTEGARELPPCHLLARTADLPYLHRCIREPKPDARFLILPSRPGMSADVLKRATSPVK